MELVYFYVLFYLQVLCLGQEINETEYYKESICGDGVWDDFGEECDGSVGCSEYCTCENGYLPDGKGICTISCIYGDACIGGCVKPDICNRCNATMGYTEDCSSCQKGYMYFGERLCKKYEENKVETCFDFIERMKGDNLSMFEIYLDGENKNVGGDNKITIPKLEKEFIKLQYSSCSNYVDPIKPYTYGVWVKLQSSYNQMVLVELDDNYHFKEINKGKFLLNNIGNDYSISSQYNCFSFSNLFKVNQCISKNGGVNGNIHSPRINVLLNENIPQYLFIHSKYAASEIKEIDIYFSEINHICSVVHQTIRWNDLSKNSIVMKLDMQYSLLSNSICRTDQIQGFWFRIDGVNQNIELSTCNSKQKNVVLDIISINAVKYEIIDSTNISFVNCSSSEHMCFKSISNGCKNDKTLSRMVVSLQHDKTYLLFVGSYDNSFSTIELNITKTCPGNCEHGICSEYSGECECAGNYTLVDGVCTLCGNGQLDVGEDCDFSVKGYQDSQCTLSCACRYGSEPILIGGITKCAVPTCGNGKIDNYEECDGGYGCDHCICVGGTKKYGKERLGCIPKTCGNKQWDEGEECDGGDGCIECECQEDWYASGRADCSLMPHKIRKGLYFTIGYFAFTLFYLFLFVVVIALYFILTKQIRSEMENGKYVVMENTIIPFDKINSQFIDIRQENYYFSFSATVINFHDVRPEIDELTTMELELKNEWKENLIFTFHSGDYTKYEIAIHPPTGVIKPLESIILTITIVVKCTTLLNEKIPVTIRFNNMKSIINDIAKNQPKLIENDSEPNQNTDSENTISPHSCSNNENEKHSSQSLNLNHHFSKKPKRKAVGEINKFHVYLGLQVESALSTKLDYEEIHLQQSPIGSGTFGIVYRAEWRRVDVAVKVMKTDLVGLAELLPNFSQEAEMMERIRCPYIISFVGSVATADALCLVTEFCPLGSLRKFINANAIPDLLKVRFCQDIAKGMEYLHENDIFHRDLKTDNVLVYSKNPNEPVTAKVTDFGTSRSFIESSSSIALQNIGTPVYMAPEINLNAHITFKSDVFSFAICMLEIWLGKCPYEKKRFPDPETILRFVNSGKRLDIPNECVFKDIIEKAWKQNPIDRPTFKEIAFEFEILLSQFQPNTPKNMEKRIEESQSSSSSNF